MEIRFNFQDFEKKFNKITKDIIPALMEKGLGQAMLNLKRDCIREIPTVPLKEGWLRDSGSIFVQNKLIDTPSMYGKDKYKNTDHSETIDIGKLVGVIGFNTPYAAKMHEGIGLHFREPSAGPKYLESKLLRNKEQYMATIADVIEEGGNA